MDNEENNERDEEEHRRRWRDIYGDMVPEKIVDTKIGEDGKRYYKVQWAASSFEPAKNFLEAELLISKYWDPIEKKLKLPQRRKSEGRSRKTDEAGCSSSSSNHPEPNVVTNQQYKETESNVVTNQQHKETESNVVTNQQHKETESNKDDKDKEKTSAIETEKSSKKISDEDSKKNTMNIADDCSNNQLDKTNDRKHKLDPADDIKDEKKRLEDDQQCLKKKLKID